MTTNISLPRFLDKDLNLPKHILKNPGINGGKNAGDLLCVLLYHDVAVDEDGADDGEGEQRVTQNMNGDSETEWTVICLVQLS